MSSVQQPGRAVGEAGARGAPHTPTPTHATSTTVTTTAAAGRQFVSPARQQQQHDVLAVGSNSNSVNANVIISGSSGLLFPGGGSGAEDDVPRGAAPLVPISLTLPRPDHQRSSNLYVDTPFPHRPTPRRPRVLPNTASTPGAVTAGSGAPSSPSSQRSPSPLDSSPPHSSSTSNLLQNAGLPSVHTTGIRSFVNPNNTSVNSSKGSTDITKYNSYSRSSLRSSNNVRCSTSSSNVKNSKLSSSSFSFSTSTSRLVSGGGGGVIQSQPSSGGGVRGGRSGGGGGKGGSFSNPLLLDTKSCLELRGGGGGVVGGAAVAAESIICSSCGRCRCEACRSPRPPPSAWLCAGKCLCSPASCVDCVSCAWCVKAALYHCGEGDGSAGGGWQGSSRRCCCGGVRARRWGLWACVAVGALPLPCLLCYFPLTALRQLLERGYQRCTSHGCRCNTAPALSPPSPTPPPARPPQSLLPFPASPAPPSLVL